MFGLNNVGATCYINSSIQCLFNDPRFINGLMKGQGPISSGLKELYLMCPKNRRNVKCTLSLVALLRKSLGKYMNFNMQNDMQEFILLLLDEISKENQFIPRCVRPSNDTSKVENYLRKQWHLQHKDGMSWITPIFYGQTLTQMECPCCKKKFHNAEVFTSLTLDITPNPNLEEMISNNFKGDVVSDWKCDSCEQTSKVVKRIMKMTRYPNTLMITVKRFGVTKDVTHVTFPKRLVIPDHVHIFDKSLVYDLISVGCHIGSAHGGHYFAQVRKDDKDYIIDDDSITETEGVDDKNAYVLFYSS